MSEMFEFLPDDTGRCPSTIATHRCAFVAGHRHPHGAQVSAGWTDFYVTWGVMGSPQQPVVGS